jgi:hypothetical protein
MIFKRPREHKVITQKVNPVYAVYSYFPAGSLCSRLEAPTFGCGLTSVSRIKQNRRVLTYCDGLFFLAITSREGVGRSE